MRRNLVRSTPVANITGRALKHHAPVEGHAKRWHRSCEPVTQGCQRFARISRDLSGPGCQTDRAPMLVGTPLPVKLSVFRALGPPLWIGRAPPTPSTTPP